MIKSTNKSTSFFTMKGISGYIKVIRSNRKTASINIMQDLSVVVRVPICMSDREVQKFVESNRREIEKGLRDLENAQNTGEMISEADMHVLGNEAVEKIPGRVAHFAEFVGVNYNKITIRNQKTRWGSCSNIGNLSFNLFLMNAPSEVLDYVIVHELCHLKEMNHSRAFWDEVEKVMPEYKQYRLWLKENGHTLRTVESMKNRRNR